jgi:hypothetical protein
VGRISIGSSFFEKWLRTKIAGGKHYSKIQVAGGFANKRFRRVAASKRSAGQVDETNSMVAGFTESQLMR